MFVSLLFLNLLSFASEVFHPPLIVVKLAHEDSMTQTAREVFYLNKPNIISDRKILNETCSDRERHSKETNLLGCYLAKDRGIYIYSITEKRLEGTMETTAAHEMLHAFYIRLSESERKYVDELIERAYRNVTDHDIHFRVELYPKEQRNAELHSILGTEILTLPPELETYYAKYFLERSRVVGFAKQSKAAIEKQIAEVSSYDRQLTQLKKNIDLETNNIINESNQVSELRKKLESIQPGERTEEYNKITEITNSHIHEYNRLVVIYDRDARDYNSMAAKRNALASDTQQLVQTLNTKEPTSQAK